MVKQKFIFYIRHAHVTCRLKSLLIKDLTNGIFHKVRWWDFFSRPLHIVILLTSYRRLYHRRCFALCWCLGTSMPELCTYGKTTGCYLTDVRVMAHLAKLCIEFARMYEEYVHWEGTEIMQWEIYLIACTAWWDWLWAWRVSQQRT